MDVQNYLDEMMAKCATLFPPLPADRDAGDVRRFTDQGEDVGVLMPFETVEEGLAWHANQLKLQGRPLPEGLRDYA